MQCVWRTKGEKVVGHSVGNRSKATRPREVTEKNARVGDKLENKRFDRTAIVWC